MVNPALPLGGAAPAPDKPLTWLERMVPLPDVRVIIAGGYFALAWRVLYIVEGNPKLLESAAFMTVVTLIFGTGGLGIVGAFWFGGTKTGSEVMASQSKALTAAPPPGTTTTTTTPGGTGP